MIGLWSTGPAMLYCGVGPGGTPLFVGTCEGRPNIQVRPEFVPHKNSVAGTLSNDQCFQGEEAWVTADVNRGNELAFVVLQSRACPGAARGTYPAGTLGRMMLLEGAAYRLWVQHPFSVKPSMAGRPAGYRFLAAYLAGPEDITAGTGAGKIRLVWHALMVRWAGANNAPQGKLFDHDMSGLPPAA
jgi:hypothetical protein